jgi:hypothetical protein
MICIAVDYYSLGFALKGEVAKGRAALEALEKDAAKAEPEDAQAA